LYVRIGDKGDSDITDRIADIANIMGDPDAPAVMRLKITSRTSLLLGNKELDDGISRTLSLNMKPSMPREYLFK
ncbi:hypothetical protein ACFLSJ_06755, partial [Verrucomicrobiota bacterium]